MNIMINGDKPTNTSRWRRPIVAVDKGCQLWCYRPPHVFTPGPGT